MIDLWRARLRQHVQAQQKYLRLVFNDHFVLILLILFGGALYVYAWQLFSLAYLASVSWRPLQKHRIKFFCCQKRRRFGNIY